MAFAVVVAATWICSVGLFGSPEDVPTPRGCKQRGSATAFAACKWPRKGLGRPNKRSKKGKKELLDLLRDDDVLIGKTQWAIRHMHKFKFWRTYWEYNMGIKKLVRVGAWFDALELWDHMKSRNIEGNGATYSFAVCALMAGRKWQHALALYEDMELANMRPLRIGAEQGLMACEKGGKWERALAILEKMWEYSQTPNEDSYMPAIRACENAGEHDRGDELFWLMRRQTKLMKVEDEDSGLDQPERPPPMAEPAPWRLPGTVALDAYRSPKKLLEENSENDQQADSRPDEPYKPYKQPLPFRLPLAPDGTSPVRPLPTNTYEAGIVGDGHSKDRNKK